MTALKSTSSAQFDAYASGRVAPIEHVRADVWAIAMDMPGEHIPSSFCYLLRDSEGGVHVVDPGWDSDANWERLVQSVTRIGSRPEEVRSALITHLHPDHDGLAARLKSLECVSIRFGRDELNAPTVPAPLDAPLKEGLLDRWGVPDDRRAEFAILQGQRSPAPPVPADRYLADREHLDIPGFDLEVIHTPGHTAGHVSFRDHQRGLLITGDHLLPTMFGGLGLGGSGRANPLADYLQSLSRIEAFAEDECLPGHGYRFTGIAERIDESRDHHLRRTREVADALRDRATLTTWEIAERLTWTAGWANLRGFYVFSALSQTQMHREYIETYGI